MTFKIQVRQEQDAAPEPYWEWRIVNDQGKSVEYGEVWNEERDVAVEEARKALALLELQSWQDVDL